MTPPHLYVAAPGEAPDYAGRVPCATCGVPDRAAGPANAHHHLPDTPDEATALEARRLGETHLEEEP